MLKKALGAIGLSVLVGFTMAIVVMQLWRADTPNANTGRTVMELWAHGQLLLCWVGMIAFLMPWVVANGIIAYRWAVALHAAAWRFQVWASWKVSEARNRAHAAEMWDNHPALTPEEQAEAEKRQLTLALFRDSMLILGEAADYIPSDDVLSAAYKAGNIRNPWGSGTRAKALAPIRDYIMVVGQGGARQTILKRGNLRVLAREIEMGSVRLVQADDGGDDAEG